VHSLIKLNLTVTAQLEAPKQYSSYFEVHSTLFIHEISGGGGGEGDSVSQLHKIKKILFGYPKARQLGFIVFREGWFLL
jgi:hypothetical protein